jgi:hypothetical protein
LPARAVTDFIGLPGRLAQAMQGADISLDQQQLPLKTAGVY